MNQMPNVLLSPVGDTDPVRNGYDGPLLHIARHYKPEAVYLFLTAEMERREEASGCYSKAVRHILPDCKIDITRSKIEDAHDFDAFQKPFDELISRIVKDYPDAEILVNITSATPQIQSALALEVVSQDARLKAVQVSTPVKKSNADISHFNAYKDDIDAALDNDLDSIPGEENRCTEPNIGAFRKTMLKRQIAALLDSYDYSGAYGVLMGENRALFGDETRELIKHAYYRSRPDNKKAEEAAESLGKLNKFYLIKDEEIKTVFEYYLITDLKFRRREYADYYLMVMKIAEHVAKVFCGIDTTDEKKWFEVRDIVRGRDTAVADMLYKIYEYHEIRNNAAHRLLETDAPPKGYSKHLKELLLKIYGARVPKGDMKRTLDIYDKINGAILDAMARE